MRFVALAVLMIVAACQAPPAEMTEAEIAQIESEVNQVMEGNLEGWRQGNVDMIVAAYHPIATAFVTSSVPRDYAGVTDWATNWFENNESWVGGWTETTVNVLGPDWAVFQGIYEATLRFGSGQVWFYPNGTFTTVMERTEDGWKITKGANSNTSGQRIDQIYGAYDWVTLGGEALPSDAISSGWLEWRPDGTWTGYSTPADGSETTSETGTSSIGGEVDGCFPFEALTDGETEPFTGTVCEGVLTADDGSFVGHKRD